VKAVPAESQCLHKANRAHVINKAHTSREK
jgi:hypothetical protein